MASIQNKILQKEKIKSVAEPEQYITYIYK